ncbi:TonB-dependent receptor plug domain-containing protein [Pontibacter litorisediminis]|uniref:TonB-dependent receptor plug domain-containing protein n=1 Tax=Pontibacter litorisediminis TaxID=1846260 RepID=UPI0023EC2AB7|nr:TonB-dependent receptor [Pontibacter litorisediminis]
MRGSVLLLLFLLSPSWLLAQVEGTVLDADTRLPVAEVVISTPSAHAVSDGRGRFFLPADTSSDSLLLLRLSHTRYRDTTMLVRGRMPLSLYLKRSSISLAEVEITAPVSSGTETAKLSREDLEAIGKPLGEADLVRALQYRPGVLQTGEMQSGLFVRGGTNAHTAMLVQGVPVFNPAHLMGINNSLDPDAYESVSLASGGFAASEGGWLSAYLQAAPRAREVSTRQLKVGTGVLSSELSYQQHLSRYKTHVFAKAKSSYYQLLAKAYEQLHSEEGQDNPLPDYAFQDVNLQVYKALPKGSLSVAAFASRDSYDGTTDRFSLASEWGNRLLSARWKHRFGPAWLELTQGYSRYAFSMEHRRQETRLLDQATSGHFSKLLLGMPLGKTGFVEAGAFLQHLQTEMASTQQDREGRLLQESNFSEKLPLLGAFAQAQATSDKFTYSAGTRLYRHNGIMLPAPRLKAEVTEDNWSGSLYYDRTFQFHHQVNVLGIHMPFDFFRFASGRLPVQRSDQVGLSVSRPVKQYNLAAGVYHRWLQGQLHYANASELLSDFTASFEPHVGRAYGAELELQAQWSRLALTASYTMAYSRLALEGENGRREWVYPVQDVRHQLSTTAQYMFNERWQLSGQWFMQTGSPYTFPVGIIPAQGMTPGEAPRILPAFGEFNNVRTPVRHRLDLGVTYKKRHASRTSEWNVGIYNAYNRANPYFLYFDVVRQEDGTGRIVSRQRSLLPFTPTLRYTCTFDL